MISHNLQIGPTELLGQACEASNAPIRLTFGREFDSKVSCWYFICFERAYSCSFVHVLMFSSKNVFPSGVLFQVMSTFPAVKRTSNDDWWTQNRMFPKFYMNIIGATRPRTVLRSHLLLNMPRGQENQFGCVVWGNIVVEAAHRFIQPTQCATHLGDS